MFITKPLRAFAGAMIVLLIFTFAGTNTPVHATGAAPFSAHEVVAGINAARIEAGLPPLSENALLTEAAHAKGTHMNEYAYFAHYAPGGTTPWEFMERAGYTYLHAGENLARDFSDVPLLIELLLASPSHRANLLDVDFTDVGVAVVEGEKNGRTTWIVVQMFGTPHETILTAT